MSVGKKPRLVCLPGWGADHRIWLRLQASLSLHFELQHIDLMDPERLPSLSSPSFESQPLPNLDQILHDLSAQIADNSLILAWSLGGMLALQLAHRYPQKVRAQIVIATNLSFVQREDWPEAMPLEVFERFVESFQVAPEKTQKRFISLQAQGDPCRKAVTQYLQQNHAFTNSGGDSNTSDEQRQKHALTLLQLLGELDCRPAAEALSAPTLMLFAEHDALVPKAAMQTITGLPNTQVNTQTNKQVNTQTLITALISNSGHVPQYSQPDQCLEHIAQFFNLREPRHALDKRRVARSFSKASHEYDACAALQKYVAEKLVGLADGYAGVLADLGCGTGLCLDLILAKSDAVDAVLALDFAEKMLSTCREKQGKKAHLCGRAALSYCRADIESLPTQNRCLDWIVSSLAIQWCDDLDAVFSEMCRTLADDGTILLSNLGPGTLWELDWAWRQAGSTHVHVNHFHSSQDIAKAAERAGLELQYVEEEERILSYRSVLDLMHDLRGIGARNMNRGGNRGLTGRAVMRSLGEAYEAKRDSKGQLPASYQIQYWLFSKRRVL